MELNEKRVRLSYKPHPGGRPLSVFDLPEEWYLKVFEIYEEGGSDIEVKAHIVNLRGTFSNDLWTRWMREEDEFSEVIKMGRILSESWWTRSGRTKLEEPKFNATLFYMNMKNRFGWSDRQEIDHRSSDGSMATPTPIMFTKGTGQPDTSES